MHRAQHPQLERTCIIPALTKTHRTRVRESPVFNPVPLEVPIQAREQAPSLPRKRANVFEGNAPASSASAGDHANSADTAAVTQNPPSPFAPSKSGERLPPGTTPAQSKKKAGKKQLQETTVAVFNDDVPWTEQVRLTMDVWLCDCNHIVFEHDNVNAEEAHVQRYRLLELRLMPEPAKSNSPQNSPGMLPRFVNCCHCLIFGTKNSV